jgi:hypothetical protein
VLFNAIRVDLQPATGRATEIDRITRIVEV